jgi:DNA polymerase IV
MSVRWIMHVDMDAFYASVEQRDNPALRGLPVIIGGLMNRGVVATASYEARAFGVHSAMSMKQARRLCPNGVFLPVRMSYYRKVSYQIRLIMSHYSPFIEPLSLDEAFLDVSGMERQYPMIKDIGIAIKNDIHKNMGLIASAGIAPNKFLAKLASDLRKPDGLMCIPYGKEQEILAPLPVSRLWGVGRVTAEALESAGIYTIGDVAAAGVSMLKSVAGSQAKRLYELSCGIDKRPLEVSRRPQSVGNEHTYEHDIFAVEEIDEQFRILANEVSWRLRRHHLMGRTITIKIRLASFQTITRSLTLQNNGTCSEEQLYFSAKKLYNKAGIVKPIRLLGLTVSQLQPLQIQGDLFSEDEEIKGKVVEAIDKLQQRFGRNAIMEGFLWELSHDKNK